MHILGIGLLHKFGKKHPESRLRLASWVAVVEKARWTTLPELKVTFRSADYVQPFIVFNLGGNKHRITALVDFEAEIVHIDELMTHSEYDVWSEVNRKARGKK